MRKCPSCQAEIADKDFDAGKCPQCGHTWPAGKATVGDIGQTLDLDDLSITPPGKGTPGKGTVDDSPGGKTVGDAPPQSRKTIDDGIGQTVDFSDLPSGEDDQGQRTVDQVQLGQTLDSQDLPPGGIGPKAGTIPDHPIDQTIDLSAGDEERMDQLWADAVHPGARPGMTIKGKESGTSQAEQNLKIQQRALRMSGDCKTSEADYELLEMLGQGGMGVVYTARQACIDRTVAVKMIKSPAAADTTQREKFLAEAVVTGELDHPNIVPIYDLGSNEAGALFYSMKRVEGTPWDDQIREKSLAENIEILMKVADAVAFAHARGVIHRDLKPENIMLGGFGEVLVMDWGLALPTEVFSKADSVGRSAGMGGTPAYMAPEMASGRAEDISYCSDIYLLGAILYEIVTGRPPHTGENTMTCLFSAAKNEIVPTDKSGELIDVALKAMAGQPAERYPTVRAFQEAIRDYLSHSESIVLSARAAEDLEEAKRTDDYQDYARAMFAFKEAYALWDGNAKARAGISAAELAYAESALRKEDYDLGLSLLEADDPSHTQLAAALRLAKAERDARQQRIQRMKRAMVAGGLLFIVGLSTASFFVWQAKNEAVANLDRALVAEKEATEERDKAKIAEGKAKFEAKRAVAAEFVAKDEAEKARKARDDAVNAQVAAEKARMDEEKAKIAAQMAREKEKDAKIAAIKAQEKEKTAKIAALKAQEKEKIARIAADKARAAEEIQRIAAEQAQQAEEYRAYIALIGLAAAKIDENAFGTARALLADCKPRLRNWEWYRLMHVCTQHFRAYDAGARVEAVAFAPGSKRFVTGSWNGLAQIWDAESGDAVNLPHPQMSVLAVAFSSDGRQVATGASDSKIRVWDATSGKLLRTLSGHADAVLSLEFSPDNKWLLSSSYDQSARLWEISTGRMRPFVGHTWWVWDASFSRDGTQIVTASQDGTARVWSVATGKPGPSFRGHRGPVYSAAFSPAGDYVVTGGYDKRVLLWRPDEVLPPDYKKLAEGDPVEPPKYVAFEGHTAAVRCVEFSQEGELLISSGHDNTVNLWHVDGHLIKSLRGHDSWVRSCAFSPDRPMILSGGYDRDNQIRLWDIAGYEEYRILRGRVLRGHADSVFAVGFSKEGDRIVTASRDRTAMVFDFRTGEPLKTLAEGHAYLASKALFFNNGQRLATAAVDNTVRLWNVEVGTQLRLLEGTGTNAALAVSHDTAAGNPGWILTGSDSEEDDPNAAKVWKDDGTLLKRLLGHAAPISAVAFSRDNRYLFTGDEGGRGKVWHTGTWREAASFLLESRRKITVAAFLPDGSRLLVGSADNTVAAIDPRSGREERSRLMRHPDSIITLAVTPDGSKVLTSCQDERVYVWDLNRTRQPLRTLATRRGAGHALAIDISPDGNTAVTVNTEGGIVQLWDLETYAEKLVPDENERGRHFLDSEKVGGTFWSAVFSPDGKQVLTVGGATARLWLHQTTRQQTRDQMSFSPNGAVASADFSPDGQFVVTGSWDNSAKIWDVAKGKAILKLEGHASFVNSAVFSPDSSLVLTASDDHKAILWNAKTGEIVHTLSGHSDRVRSAVFSHDGKFVLTASNDETARIWETATGRQVGKPFVGHRFAVLCAAFSPDGSRIITGGEDNTAKIWDVKTRQEIATIIGHTASVTSVAYAPDGNRVLTGSDDYTAKLWDASDGHEGEAVLNLKGHTQEVTSVRFSQDGHYAVTGSRDGTAMVWLTSPDHWKAAAKVAAVGREAQE